MVKFVGALAYHSCPSLPAAFTQAGWSLLAEPCRAQMLYVKSLKCSNFHATSQSNSALHGNPLGRRTLFSQLYYRYGRTDTCDPWCTSVSCAVSQGLVTFLWRSHSPLLKSGSALHSPTPLKMGRVYKKSVIQMPRVFAMFPSCYCHKFRPPSISLHVEVMKKHVVGCVIKTRVHEICWPSFCSFLPQIKLLGSGRFRAALCLNVIDSLNAWLVGPKILCYHIKFELIRQIVAREMEPLTEFWSDDGHFNAASAFWGTFRSISFTILLDDLIELAGRKWAPLDGPIPLLRLLRRMPAFDYCAVTEFSW